MGRHQVSATVQPPFTKDTIIADSNIVVEDDAKKHEAEFASGRRKPTDADIRTAFKAAVKYGGPPTREPGGTWKWEEYGLDTGVKPARQRKRNNICFRVSGAQYIVFHYHKGFYD